MPYPLDEFDRKILTIVQLDNRAPSEEIGQRVGLSGSAVQRRLQKLRTAGIITADISVVDPVAAGGLMTVVIEVTLERERQDLFDAFKATLLETPEVQQCYYLTGRIDFLVIAVVRDMGHYEAFSQRLFFGNANVRRFQTSVVMRSIKTGLSVPMA